MKSRAFILFGLLFAVFLVVSSAADEMNGDGIQVGRVGEHCCEWIDFPPVCVRMCGVTTIQGGSGDYRPSRLNLVCCIPVEPGTLCPQFCSLNTILVADEKNMDETQVDYVIQGDKFELSGRRTSLVCCDVDYTGEGACITWCDNDRVNCSVWCKNHQTNSIFDGGRKLAHHTGMKKIFNN